MFRFLRMRPIWISPGLTVVAHGDTTMERRLLSITRRFHRRLFYYFRGSQGFDSRRCWQGDHFGRAGQYSGEMAAIDGAKRSANVTALTNSEVCIMPTSVFREMIFSSQTICERVLRLLTGRIRELNARITEHSIFDLKHRLYSELLRMARPRQGRADQRAVTPPPLHHVLAARIGCRREQVTRDLSAPGDTPRRGDARWLLTPDGAGYHPSESIR
jgi:cyclic nucleotide-binding protein